MEIAQMGRITCECCGEWRDGQFVEKYIFAFRQIYDGGRAVPK
jgi:hypothetical protein